MFFKRFETSTLLKKLVECYWVVESNDTTPVIQKIIPDGFPELIFHYRDPYKINIDGHWQLQSKTLLAGQLKKYFFLQNTSASGVFGIKCKPTALTHLFGISIKDFNDDVVALTDLNIPALNVLMENLASCATYENMIGVTDKYLQAIIHNHDDFGNDIDTIIDLIFESNGMVSIMDIQKQFYVTQRQLQRRFEKYIGVSPKFYTRIIRFNYVFQLMKDGKFSWLDVTHRCGYFDQSHFIRDFKSFTGEDPSKYIFDEPGMANFFLKKQ